MHTLPSHYRTSRVLATTTFYSYSFVHAIHAKFSLVNSILSTADGMAEHATTLEQVQAQHLSLIQN